MTRRRRSWRERRSSAKGLDANLTTGVKAFLAQFASAGVQKGLVDIGYAPLPTAVQADVVKAIAGIA